jgi:tRNA(Ile)-lysidine synthase
LKINLSLLKNGKNLLAFSAGVDSSALFFILLENKIEFDIAIVNYGLRQEAEEEIAYAKELASKYNKKIFIADAPKFSSNFEANAREFRYTFFNEIITKYGYSNLTTAHQLNDKLEWLLMRLSQGAGVVELSGLEEISKRENYTLVRPILNYTKDELLEYLDKREIKYFIDKSNFDTKYRRNQYRPLVDELLQKSGKNGFVKSFNILNYESSIIKESFKTIFKERELRVLKLENQTALPYATSYTLKELGYLLSGKEREALKRENSIVVGRKWAVEYSNNILYISPYIVCKIPKEFKEFCRVKKIPPKVRGYIYKEKIDFMKDRNQWG